MNGSVIVWDLETVPDLPGFAAANGLAGKPDEEVREAIGDNLSTSITRSCASARLSLTVRTIIGRSRPSEPY